MPRIEAYTESAAVAADPFEVRVKVRVLRSSTASFSSLSFHATASAVIFTEEPSAALSETVSGPRLSDPVPGYLSGAQARSVDAPQFGFCSNLRGEWLSPNPRF